MMKLESDRHVVREGSCKECVRCLRLYLCDAEDCGGMSVRSPVTYYLFTYSTSPVESFTY